MKKYLFLSLALLATAITGCKEDEPVVDNPTPKVTLEAGATTETTATFTVSSEDAQQVAYILYSDDVPAAEVILADGTAVAANEAVEVTLEDLTPETTYNLVAAASNGEKTAVSSTISLTTLKGEEPGPGPEPGPQDELEIVKIEGGLSSYQNYRMWITLNNEALLYLDIHCADSEHNMIPAGEYPVVFLDDPEAEYDGDEAYYVRGDGSSYQLGYDMIYLREGKVVFSHLEAGYGVDVDVVLNDDELTPIKVEYEGIIPAHEIGGDFRNPPYVEPTKNEIEMNITEIGAAFGNNPGDSWYFWVDTAEADAYSAFLMLNFPKVTDAILPAATYTYAKDYSAFRDDEGNVKAGEYRILCASTFDSHINDKAADSYIALTEETTLTVEHGNGTYILTFNLVGENGVILTARYETDNFRKQWDWEGANEFKFPGQGGTEPTPEPNCTMKGACRNNAFELCVYEPEQTSEILYISGNHNGTIMNVIPEGEYPFYTEYKENMLYVRADWSASYNPDYSRLVAGGLLTIAHTDNGYNISVECTDENGVAYSYSYVGALEPNNEWSSVGNPPIPYDENTYDLTIDTVVGQASSGNFYIYATASNGYEFCFNVKSEGKGYDGIIPAGTYSFGGTDYVMSANDTWMRFEEEGDSIGFSEGTLVVEHLAEGYRLTFSGKNLLKTTYNFKFEGIVGTHENAQYPFENPGVVIPAYWDFVFTTCTYGGLKSDNEGGQTIRAWDFTNEAGDKFSLYLDATFTENGVVAGTYTSCYGFESWYGYTPGQQKFTQCPLDPHDSPQSYSFWVADGAFNITDAGSGNFNVSWSGYLWITDGYKKVNISYTGAMPME